MALLPKLQLFFGGIFFGSVLFVVILKHPPTISSCLAASNLCLACDHFWPNHGNKTVCWAFRASGF